MATPLRIELCCRDSAGIYVRIIEASWFEPAVGRKRPRICRAHATPHLRSDQALDAVGICYRSLQTDRSFAAEPVNIDECTDRGCLGDHSGGRRARDGKQLGSEQASGDAAG